jgi:hypothetical protein
MARPIEFEAELGEKRDSGIKRFHDDADVVHPLERQEVIVAYRTAPMNFRCATGLYRTDP